MIENTNDIKPKRLTKIQYIISLFLGGLSIVLYLVFDIGIPTGFTLNANWLPLIYCSIIYVLLAIFKYCFLCIICSIPLLFNLIPLVAYGIILNSKFYFSLLGFAQIIQLLLIVGQITCSFITRKVSKNDKQN